MDKLTTKDIAEVLTALAIVWEDYSKSCELRAMQIADEMLSKYD